MITLKGKKCVTGGCSESMLAVVTDKGELYTWGKGGYKTLATGKKTTLPQPQLVEFFKDKPVKKYI